MLQQGPLDYEDDLTEQDAIDFSNLLRAIQTNDDTTTKSLLAQKPYLCALVTDTGVSALIAAVCLADTCATSEIFNLLINNPYTDLNGQNSAGYSALHFMADHNHYALMNIFLNQTKQKIEVNLLTSANVPDVDKAFTPVYLASLNGHREALYLLIKAGADVNIASGVLQWSPLHIACLKGYEDCVFQLLEAQANPNAQDGDGAIPAHDLAIAQGIDQETFERIKEMLKVARTNFRAKSKGFMPDEFAVYSGNADALILSESLKSCRITSLQELARDKLAQINQPNVQALRYSPPK